MIKTLSIRELESKAANIYEAIIILAKRARQINDDHKQMMVQEQDYDDDYEDFDEFDVRVRDEDVLKLPKPTSISLDEFMQGDIRFDYGVQDDEEETSSSN